MEKQGGNSVAWAVSGSKKEVLKAEADLLLDQGSREECLRTMVPGLCPDTPINRQLDKLTKNMKRFWDTGVLPKMGVFEDFV